jgi:hypothetical protein
MEYKKACENVGFDGESFFCLRCYKAGFATQQQAVGHQRWCKAKASLGNLPPKFTTSSTTSAPPYSGATLPANIPPELSEYDKSAISRILAMQVQKMSQEISEIKRYVTNEIPHMQAKQQMSGIGDWIEANKGTIILVAAGLLVILLLRESKCNCEKRGSLLADVAKTAGIYGVKRILK